MLRNEHFRVETNGSPGQMSLVGEFDLAGVGDFQAALENAPLDGGLTLDLKELTFIDSTGLHAIVQCAKMGDGDGKVRVVNVSEHVMRVFEIAGLDHHPRIEFDVGGDGVE